MKIRTVLATDRTRLANERTVLAYGRTALGLAAMAAFLFKFADPLIGIVFGPLSLTGAAAIMYVGIRNFRREAVRIEARNTIPLETNEIPSATGQLKFSEKPAVLKSE